MDKVIKDIKDQISDNKVLLFMKGSPYQPQCGFSSKVVLLMKIHIEVDKAIPCLLYTSPSPRDRTRSRMPSSA